VKLLWTDNAISDRLAIYEYIESDNPLAAIEHDQLLAHMASRLMDHPHMGRPGRVFGTRELVAHRNYILVYDVLGDEAIRILRVLHAARMWPTSN